jgi:hypothetical protein
MQAPWTHRVLRLNLTAPLPAATPPRSVTPWVVQLADGARCSVATGATAIIHGKVAAWYCGDGSQLAALIRHRRPQWWAYRVTRGGAQWIRIDVTRAWE